MSEQDTSHRPFPIQAGKSYRGEDRGMIYPKRSTVPWWLAEIAYSEYVRQHGDSQSMERMAERGGFGRQEFLFYLGLIGEDEL